MTTNFYNPIPLFTVIDVEIGIRPKGDSTR